MHKASRQIFFSISHSRSKKVSWRSGGGLVVSSRNKFILSIVRRYNRMWEAKSSTRFVARYGTGSTSLALKIRTTKFKLTTSKTVIEFWENCEGYCLLLWECSDYTLNRKAKMCLKRATVIYLSIPRVNKITKSVIQDLKKKQVKCQGGKNRTNLKNTSKNREYLLHEEHHQWHQNLSFACQKHRPNCPYECHQLTEIKTIFHQLLHQFTVTCSWIGNCERQ